MTTEKDSGKNQKKSRSAEPAKKRRAGNLPKNGVRTFQAELELLRSRLSWVIARVPFEVQEVWGKRGRLRVRGEINGFEFRTSLFPTRQGEHFILINKHMQRGARATIGAKVRIRMEPDLEERVVAVPIELKRILNEERTLRQWFEKLNYSTRKELCSRVSEGKARETRERRAEQMAEFMMTAMEGERELPPILRVAFAENPGAEEGWMQMSPSHRRGHLMGVFYYSGPETRARRVAKIVDEALRLREKLRARKA